MDYIKTIKNIIAKHSGLDVSEIDSGMFLHDDLNLSELEITEILTEIEEQLHVELIEQRADFETIEDIADTVAEQVE